MRIMVRFEVVLGHSAESPPSPHALSWGGLQTQSPACRLPTGPYGVELGVLSG